MRKGSVGRKLGEALMKRLWWLASNSHGSNGDAQLECSGDRTTPDIPDLTRAVYSPSSSSGVSHGDQE
ncbi:hypothetical protein RHMOL_Rhmol09G0141400 [Rhododendron molle]|uniref:Uncharacterized protein n=1 Tax=Rhododendron molle TaxID=49168 RepID=A0ACC0MEY1_RHOML|nr:hypothetical protein RHMOL_Rhmol09G0141400 [Rhododendron molle]